MAANIKTFYRGKNILVTGGTGFLGLAIVEKILRTFPDVEKIFMIVRSCKGQSIQQRKEEYFKNPVFNRLKSEGNCNFEKLIWIEGDLLKSDLGLSLETKGKLQESVNMIIHSGATVSFFEPLKTAIEVNISATNDLLNIASGCKNLDCFVHISTAFCKGRRSIKHIDETILEHPIAPRELMQFAKTHTDEEVNDKMAYYIQDWPNTYTYTKNAAENVCAERQGEFPIVIYRPSIVMPSYAEPLPYWIGNVMAYPRFLMEAHRGLFVTAPPHINGHCVPVDLTINGMLMAAYRAAKEKTFCVYNYTTSSHPFGFNTSFQHYVKSVPNYEALIKKRRALLAMKQPKPGSKEHQMIRNFHRFEVFHQALRYFQDNHFTLSNDNIDRMWDEMADDERQLLPFDVRCVDWPKYYENMYQNMHGTEAINFDELDK